jgi:hypothetical protein
MYVFPPWLDNPIGPRPPHWEHLCTGDQPVAKTSTLQHMTLTRYRHPARGRIQIRNTSKRPAADPGLRPLGHRDRPVRYHYTKIHWSPCKIHSELRPPDWAWMAPRHYTSYIKLTYVSRTYLKIFKNSKLGPSTECSNDAPTTDTSPATAKLTSVLDK